MKYGINTLEDFQLEGKTVLCRVDINSPLTADKTALADTTRLRRCLPTLRELSQRGAKTVILAHQGSDIEYQNFSSTRLHRQVLADLLERPVLYIDDVCGPAARAAIKGLSNGELLLLDNVRYMAEEMTLFETNLRLSPQEQANTIVVRKLAPLADLYVCDAFAAAHRSQPSLVGFPRVLPAAMGRLFAEELEALQQVRDHPRHPCVFVLGGAKIQDAFMMMQRVLAAGSADKVLTAGLLGNIMLLAAGCRLGEPSRQLIRERGLEGYLETAATLLKEHGRQLELPRDLAYIKEGKRQEVLIAGLPVEQQLVDIGTGTIQYYKEIIAAANTIFFNGPAGVFEDEPSALGTRQLLAAIASSRAYSVVGGGDSITAVNKFKLARDLSYICTAGGGLVRYMSGEELPVVTALRKTTTAKTQI